VTVSIYNSLGCKCALSSFLARFLDFKGLLVPHAANCTVLVSRPGQPLLGLKGPELWGVVNLGEETTSLVFANLHSSPMRLRLEPGEGLRFPAGGLLVDGCTLDKREPDVLLLVSRVQPR
jgi:hypothetical protein